MHLGQIDCWQTDDPLQVRNRNQFTRDILPYFEFTNSSIFSHVPAKCVVNLQDQKSADIHKGAIKRTRGLVDEVEPGHEGEWNRNQIFHERICPKVPDTFEPRVVHKVQENG